jgi:hypothetical protein
MPAASLLERRRSTAKNVLLCLASSTGLLVGPRLAAAQDPPGGAVPPAAEAEEPPAVPWYQQLTFNGFASGSFVGNFNRPPSRTNQYRVFDTDEGGFTLDVVELVLQRPAAKPGDFGFRTDLAVGSSMPKVMASAGLFRDEDGTAGNIDLFQGFVSYIVPVGKGLRVDAGKFFTSFGYELIDGYEGYNDNHSHSFLFGFAEPAAHTGVRLSYPLSAKLAVQVMVVNGWDVAKDNNRGKTVGGQLALTPTPWLTAYVNYLGGPEQDGNAHMRHAFDLAVTGKVSKRVTLGLNYDYGTEEKVALAETAGGGVRDAHWQGVAGYLRVAVTERFAVGLRADRFDDTNGARTSVMQTLEEVTLTPQMALTPHVTLRGDLRRDRSDRDVFERHDGTPGRGQTTASLNAVVTW